LGVGEKFLEDEGGFGVEGERCNADMEFESVEVLRIAQGLGTW